jgi:hypothetical protein
MKYLSFAHLCWKAYNGDIGAGLQVIAILRDRLGVKIKVDA